MPRPRKPSAPPAPDPKPGRNPGYAEPQPRTPGEARNPDPKRKRDPEAGGLGRAPETGPGPGDG